MSQAREKEFGSSDTVGDIPTPERSSEDEEIDEVETKKGVDGGANSLESNSTPRTSEKRGKRKVAIEFIHNKAKRHVTFSKRKAGLMKKANELSHLTGSQVAVIVASETGNIYSFATPAFQPLLNSREGKNLIKGCIVPDKHNTEKHSHDHKKEIHQMTPEPQHLVESATPAILAQMETLAKRAVEALPIHHKKEQSIQLPPVSSLPSFPLPFHSNYYVPRPVQTLNTMGPLQTAMYRPPTQQHFQVPPQIPEYALVAKYGPVSPIPANIVDLKPDFRDPKMTFYGEKSHEHFSQTGTPEVKPHRLEM